MPPRTQTERLIATLMADLLDRERVGLHDSFVALGGDSIMALDLAARARRHGAVISARDVLDRTTVGDIAALAEVAARADTPTSPAELDGTGEGRLPLPPIARFMFERGGSITQLSQSMLLTLSPAATHDEIAVTIEAVIDHHDMLRSRLVAVPDDVDELQVLAPGTIDARALLHRVTLDPQLSEQAFRDAVARHLAAAVTRLDPSQAVMSQWIWLDFGQVRPGLMLVVAHHLVVDAVSWRILVQDLIMAAGQLAGGTRIALPQVGTSTRRWALTLAEEARSGARRDELPVWLTIVGRHDPPMGRRRLDPDGGCRIHGADVRGHRVRGDDPIVVDERAGERPLRHR